MPLLASNDPDILVPAIEAVGVLNYREAWKAVTRHLGNWDLRVQNAGAGTCTLLGGRGVREQ